MNWNPEFNPELNAELRSFKLHMQQLMLDTWEFTKHSEAEWIEAWVTHLYGERFVKDVKADPKTHAPLFKHAGLSLKVHGDHSALEFHGKPFATFSLSFTDGHLNITAQYPIGFVRP